MRCGSGRRTAVWWASVNYWKPPVDAEEKTHLCGAVDVGITPLAVDSELVHYDNPKALGQIADANSAGGSEHWNVAPWAPEAGTRRNGGSLPFTDAASDCGRTRTTR